MSEITQVIIAATALIAVIVGPITSIYVTRRQIRASVVSTNRQAWINSLRDTIADYLSAEQVVFISKHSEFWEKPDVQQALEKLILLEYRIRLLINPKEPDHAKLIELILKESTNLTKSLESPPTEFSEDERYSDDEIITLAQSILKREWKRVQNGD